jgi:hypothetical protein
MPMAQHAFGSGFIRLAQTHDCCCAGAFLTIYCTWLVIPANVPSVFRTTVGVTPRVVVEWAASPVLRVDGCGARAIANWGGS